MQAIFLIGVPGVGKSTFIHNYFPDLRATYVYSSDRVVEEYAALQGKTYDEVWSDYVDTAQSIINEELREAIKLRCDLIIDRTNLTAKARRRIISQLPKIYDEIIAVVFRMPESEEDKNEHERRLNSRPGKTIPMYVIEQMKSTYQKPTFEEGFTKIRYIDMYQKELETGVAA